MYGLSESGSLLGPAVGKGYLAEREAGGHYAELAVKRSVTLRVALKMLLVADANAFLKSKRYGGRVAVVGAERKQAR